MTSLPLILRLAISAAYLVVAAFIFIKQPLQAPLFDWTFGLACVAYGVFRGTRAIKDFKAENESE